MFTKNYLEGTAELSLHWTRECRYVFADRKAQKPRRTLTYVVFDNNNYISTMHLVFGIIIHQTHYEKSDWSRAFNQFTIACELDMINAISAADIAVIMSSSRSAWLLSPLECSPQKQNG